MLALHLVKQLGRLGETPALQLAESLVIQRLYRTGDIGQLGPVTPTLASGKHHGREGNDENKTRGVQQFLAPWHGVKTISQSLLADQDARKKHCVSQTQADPVI